ncbi:hypothetical protein EJB05_10919, partial [Eragrostis curvula]
MCFGNNSGTACPVHHTHTHTHKCPAMVCRAALATLLWLSAAPWLPAVAGGTLAPPAGQECQTKCGSVDIPYPFGYGPDHCMRSEFLIQCNDTGNGVFKPFLGTTNVEVLDISLRSGQARVLNNISDYCYDASSQEMKPSEWYWDLKGTLFTFSDTANKFTVVGCRTLAYIGDSTDDAAAYTTGCVSMCRPHDTAALINSSCSGMGCCLTAIPAGLQYYQVWFDRRLSANNSKSPCSYAVLMESSNFTFSTNYVTSSSELLHRQVPVVLEWVVGYDGCEIASKCVSSNSQCITRGRGGYICNCTEGFEGNPYLPDGCKDINECDDPTKYPCFGECFNTNGSFTCSCPAGTRGNASIQACQKDPFPPGARLAVGIVACFLVGLVIFLAIEVFCHKQRNKRQGYFEEHGGQMLSRILKTEGNIDFTFFNRGEILKATRNFHKSNIIGEGAHGSVYKAVLTVGGATTTVAVKRCKQIDKSRTEEFVQELVILCRVSHPNVVKLLGCCLHFEAPMLVYEFVRNGTLNDLLHHGGRTTPKQRVTLATRLRIAAEAAAALAHLHAPPHTTFHGDVKPENILLGEGWAAKVSDFGCSTLDDGVQVAPKGTLAYLDPEFLQDFQITDRNDVYSLGVVLMELLTRTKPPAKEQKNLRIRFQESIENGTLGELLDADIVGEEEGALGVIYEAAELARRCTAVPGKTRPAMGQVADELRRLSNRMPERANALQDLEVPGYDDGFASTESETTGFYSLGSKAALSTELAR